MVAHIQDDTICDTWALTKARLWLSQELLALPPHCYWDPVTAVFTANSYSVNPMERQQALWSCSFCPGVALWLSRTCFLSVCPACISALLWLLMGLLHSSCFCTFSDWPFPGNPFSQPRTQAPVSAQKRIVSSLVEFPPRLWGTGIRLQVSPSLMQCLSEPWIEEDGDPFPNCKVWPPMLAQPRELLWRLPLGRWLLSLFETEKEKVTSP